MAVNGNGPWDEALGRFKDLLEMSVTYPGPGSGPAAAFAAPLSAERYVESQVRAILGHVPRPGDIERTFDALDRSFARNEDYEYVWRPGAVTGVAGLGANVTGYQASVAALADGFSGEIARLIRRMDTPLGSPSQTDPDRVASAQALATHALTSLVAELKAEGGPSIPRATLLADRLAEQVTELGRELRFVNSKSRRAKIDRTSVVTPEDESRITDFITLRSRVRALRREVRSLKDRLPRDLGREGLRLRRLLGVLAEQRQDLATQMDAVGVGLAERQIQPIEPGRRDGLTLQQLLDWVQALAETEGPIAISEGGAPGVECLENEAGSLLEQAEMLRTGVEGAPRAGVPDGLRHPRVVRAVRDLIATLELIAPPRGADGPPNGGGGPPNGGDGPPNGGGGPPNGGGPRNGGDEGGRPPLGEEAVAEEHAPADDGGGGGDDAQGRDAA